MSIEIKTPTFPESVAEGEIATWHFAKGDAIDEGDVIVEIETDKVVMEVPAAHSGVMGEILAQEGDTVSSDQLIAHMEAGEAKSEAKLETKAEPKPETKAGPKSESKSDKKQEIPSDLAATLSPSARRKFAQGELPMPINSTDVAADGRIEKRTPMSRMRKTIANRLLQVQQSSAILTTFNEVDMHAVKKIRAQYKDQFIKKHDSKLGFMSFFVKATVEALKQFPDVNASIDGSDLVYHGYFDIGIAVSSPRGLVVPVIRNADQLSFAQIEQQIVDYAIKARDGKLTIEDMQGGTFTITNGGTFGSMLSTPIINAPQSAILGMHNIVDRPMAVNGEVKIRPIMYLALSYDHRIIDGKDSVSFLKTIKDLLEDPARILLSV